MNLTRVSPDEDCSVGDVMNCIFYNILYDFRCNHTNVPKTRRVGYYKDMSQFPFLYFDHKFIQNGNIKIIHNNTHVRVESNICDVLMSV